MKINEGDKALVAENIAAIIGIIQPLIEGKFIDSFHVAFELESCRYNLYLVKGGETTELTEQKVNINF